MPESTNEPLVSLNADTNERITIVQAIEIALEHHVAGRLAQAEAICRQLVRQAPAHPVAPHLLGIIAHQTGHHDEALACYTKALSLSPDYTAAYNNLGKLYDELGKPDEAMDCFTRALKLTPNYASAHNNLGNLFHKQGKFDEALVCFRTALSLTPGDGILHSNLGNILQEQGHYKEAIASYQQALSLKPDYAEAHNNLGSLFNTQGRHDEAAACFRQALSLKPDYAEAHKNLGDVLATQGFHDDALTSFRQALAIKPAYTEARWAITLSQIPLMYDQGTTPEESRSRISTELAELETWINSNAPAKAFQSVGNQQPFMLAYQEHNNRELLATYGSLCVRLMGQWKDTQHFDLTPEDPGKHIRLGIVSAHVRNHSVWNALVKGWLQHLDKDRFEYSIFHLGTRTDGETSWARSQAASFSQGSKGLYQWVEAILNKHVDVLIYPDIGMNPMTQKLASLRLAPVQVATWGHPETTGLSTIDYYLSAEDLEPAHAQENYTEKLVELPHLGCCYHPPPVTPRAPDPVQLAIDPNAPILICPGVPFKYLPTHDQLYTEIARKLGRCQFVFFTPGTGNPLSERLQQRLTRVFRQADMDIHEYVNFIPWLERPAFHGLMEQADVYMDTIGFSGFNTAMQAIECGLPVITREGRFMRGRFASGILRRMGLTELIADSSETYVELIVRLVQDTSYRQKLQQRIRANRHVLFDDLAPVHALEEFLTSVANRH